MNDSKFQTIAATYKEGKRRDALKMLKNADTSCSAKISFVSVQGWASGKHAADFWKHPLAKQLISGFSSSAETEELIIGYFSQKGKIQNPQSLVLKFLKAAPQASISAIRRSKRFLDHSFWRPIETYFRPDSEVKAPETLRAFRAMDKLRKEYSVLQQAVNILEPRLRGYDIFELLILISIYLEKERLITTYAQGETFEAVEMNFLSIVERVLSEKVSLGFKENERDTDSEFEKMDSVLKRCLREKDYFAKFDELMERWKALEGINSAIDMYALQGYEFHEFEDGVEMFLPPDRSFEERWQRVGAKYQLMANWYLEEAQAAQWMEGKTSGETASIRGDEMFFKDLNIPSRIEVNGAQIEPQKILRFWGAYAENIADRYIDEVDKKFLRYHQHGEKSPTENALQAIVDTMIQRGAEGIMVGPLQIREEREVLDHCYQMFLKDSEFSPSVMRPQMRFISSTLRSKDKKPRIDLMTRPLIRVGNMLLCFASIMGRKFYSNGIHNRVLEELTKQGQEEKRKEKANGLVQAIGEKFSQQKFQVELEYKIRRKDNSILTDMDVLAYKNGTLLLIEVKDTYSRYTMSQIYAYRPTLEKAGKQLDKGRAYLDSDLAEFEKMFGEEVKHIYSFIVTSTPEGDYERWGERAHAKISYFELQVILSRSRYGLANRFTELLVGATGDQNFAEQMINKLKMSPDREDVLLKLIRLVLNHSESAVEEYRAKFDLENDRAPISPEDVIDAIETDLVWRDVIPPPKQEVFSDSDAPHILEAWYAWQKGMYHKKEQGIELAIPFFEKAVRLAPNDTHYQIDLADALAEVGRKEEALKFYEQAIACDPQVFEAYTNQAVTYAELGLLPQAIAATGKALNLQPANVELLADRMRLHLRSGDEKSALADYSRINELAPANLNAYGIIWGYLREILDSQKQIELKSAEAYLERMQLHQAVLDSNGALKIVNRGLEFFPEHGYLWKSRAWFKFHNEMYEEALNDIEQAIQLSPKEADFLDFRSYILEKLGQEDTAIASIKAALAADPKFARALTNLGLRLAHQKAYTEAIVYLEKSAEMPETAKDILQYDAYKDALYGLGYCYEQLSQWEKAATHYQKAFLAGKDEALRDWMNVFAEQLSFKYDL